MEAQDIINGLIALCGFAGGYILNSLKRSVDDLSNKVQHVELLVAGKYVTRQDFEKFCDKFYAKLELIDSKLDKKLDR